VRTRERILEAALREFSDKGFAGARVDSIASAASINKRMLYHYFGDKEGLFREVLRNKMAQRRAWNLNTPDNPVDGLPYWFDLAHKDRQWIRLLEWEALQFTGGKFIDQQERAGRGKEAVKRISKLQKIGHITKNMDPAAMLLGMVALSWFPVAFPQITRIITGRWTDDPTFVRQHREFLKKVAVAFAAASVAKGNKAKS
jgi:AcrR family transcriptional regulator